MRYFLATIACLAISFLAHKIIANPDLYFILGAVDGFVATIMLFDVKVKS